jgi:hypothetical protein
MADELTSTRISRTDAELLTAVAALEGGTHAEVLGRLIARAVGPDHPVRSPSRRLAEQLLACRPVVTAVGKDAQVLAIYALADGCVVARHMGHVRLAAALLDLLVAEIATLRSGRDGVGALGLAD